MTMRLIECEQGTAEWHAARCGRVTASRVADICRKTKSGVSKMRATYMGELVAERLSGHQPSDGYVSPAMQWGKDCEDKARLTYAFYNDIEPQRVGFVLHPAIDMAGASPDSLVGDDGLLQIKCPQSATHIDSLLDAPIEPDYFKQMQWEMACAERAFCDYVSFDPRLPPSMQMHVHRVHRDAHCIAELEQCVREFLIELDAKLRKLVERYDAKLEAAE